MAAIWMPTLLLSCLFSALGHGLEARDVIFVIISQGNSHHEKLAAAGRDHIQDQAEGSVVYLTHLDVPHPGDWTVVPLLSRLWEEHEAGMQWLFFGTEDTRVHVARLVDTLRGLDAGDEVFVGRALRDAEPTIIHHFASNPEFRYPLFSSGFALSRALVKRLADAVEEKGATTRNEFSIDASYELAMFIHEVAGGLKMTTSQRFCTADENHCATHVKTRELCKVSKSKSTVLFAVKTCRQFHRDRVPIVKETWGKYARHIAYFSEAADADIPTVKLNVRNTGHGHCSKTRAILREAKTRMTSDMKLKWVVIADDDTILSVRRTEQLLGCYDPKTPMVVGERYGYSVMTDSGYNYVTGGGGVAVSRAAIMLYNKDTECQCPSDSTPDDMFLFGVCVDQLNITMVHVPLFHQARPIDYSPDYVAAMGQPISFHKHWMVDPVQVYKDWFLQEDSTHFTDSQDASTQSHSEL